MDYTELLKSGANLIELVNLSTNALRYKLETLNYIEDEKSKPSIEQFPGEPESFYRDLIEITDKKIAKLQLEIKALTKRTDKQANK